MASKMRESVLSAVWLGLGVVAASTFGAVWAWRRRRGAVASDPWEGARVPMLFNTDPESINLRSADNLRLMTEAEVRAYEAESREDGA